MDLFNKAEKMLLNNPGMSQEKWEETFDETPLDSDRWREIFKNLRGKESVDP